MQPLQDGLRDKSAYVRKTAVMGSVKLFYVNETVLHGACRGMQAGGLAGGHAFYRHRLFLFSCRLAQTLFLLLLLLAGVDCNIADTLYGMLSRDKDPQVVANCVIALEEVLPRPPRSSFP